MSKLYYCKVSDYASAELATAIESIFECSDAAKRLTPESRVLLKPNLLAKHKPDAAVTTHPAILREVIFALQRRGVKSIIVADSAGGVYRPELMRSLYEVSGLAQVCAKAGVELYTECKFKPLTSEGQLCRSWNLINPVHDCDFIINLPKMKTHMMMSMSCAVKNLFGCIPGLQKAELHMRFPEKEAFAAMLCDLYEAIKPDMNIADGILSMEGNGPAGGTPRKSEVLLACDNAALLDLAVCHIIGMAPSEVPYMQELMRRGLCPQELSLDLLEKAMPPRIQGYKLPSGTSSINFSSALPAPLRGLMSFAQRVVAPRPLIDKKTCIGCAKCAEICPARVITIQSHKAHIDSKSCIRCFCCHEVCPVKAIAVKRSRLFRL